MRTALVKTMFITMLSVAGSASLIAAQNGYQAAITPEKRPMLGVQMTPVPLSVQEQQGLAPSQGVYVQNVYGGTAAQTMGLQPGDVITGINGAPISGMSDIRNEVSLNQVGDPVEVTIVRGGQEQGTIGQFQPWPANIPYDPIDPAMEDRFREWQERRLARTQNEVDQLREQTAAMAKALEESKNAAKDPNLFGISERAPLGPDGMPLAWRFHYGIGLIPVLAQSVANQVIDQSTKSETTTAETTTAESTAAATATATRTWRFDWRMASNRPAQEPL